MSRLLFLDNDDERHRRFTMMTIGESVFHVYTADEAIAALSAEVFDAAYLDHDLSEAAAMGKPIPDEKTGTDVAKFIAALPESRRPGRVVIHSYNPDGALRMHRLLRDAGVRQVYRVPFSATDGEYLLRWLAQGVGQ